MSNPKWRNPKGAPRDKEILVISTTGCVCPVRWSSMCGGVWLNAFKGKWFEPLTITGWYPMPEGLGVNQ